MLSTLVESALTILLTLVALLLLDWRFAVVGLLAVPLQAVALRWYLYSVAPLTRSERVAEAPGPSSCWSRSAPPRRYGLMAGARTTSA